MPRRLSSSFSWLLTFALVACATKTQPPAHAPAAASAEAQQDADRTQRLDRLVQRLEEARVEHHVPGMAIAVVHDDEVVLAKGFGVIDLDSKEPVTPQTLFAIGSTTKAFTSTLAGMLVDDGKLRWDDAVDKWVPELKLKPEGEGQIHPTLRDVMSHRTGFTRMSLLWISGEVPRQEVLSQASRAEAWAPYRKEFLYNNVLYSAAGEASARAAQSQWEALLRDRLLTPLQMKSTTTSVAEAQRGGQLAQGYVWQEVEKSFRAVPIRDIASVAPAGGINSNVQDMAQWVRLLLGDGEYQGKRLVSKAALRETWTSQIEIGPGVQYGMGWFLRDWRGKKVVEHGGNIDGYAAQVALIPEENLGFVLLTNTSYTPLQQASLGIVWEALLAEAPAESDEEDLHPYVGEYVADFGPFDDVRFTVTKNAGKLYVDVPGQMNYELKPPGEDGRRPFAMTDTISVSFERRDDEVVMMRMQQGGFDFELPKEGWQPPPEVPLPELEPYLGRFANEKLGVATVLVKNNHLAIDIPKQMVFELRPPDAKGLWAFRIKEDIAVEFPKSGDTVDALTVHQQGEKLVFDRVKDAPKKAGVPSLKRLASRRRVDRLESALAKAGVVVAKGKVRLPQSAVEGTITIWFDAAGRARSELDLGRYGTLRHLVLADTAWTHPSFGPREVHRGKYFEQAQLAHPLSLVRDWTKIFDEVRVTGERDEDGRKVVLVSLVGKEVPALEAEVDPKTGDVVQTKGVKLAPGVGGIPTTTKYGDHRKVLGVRFPFRIETSDPHSGKVIVELDSVERVRGEAADEVFSATEGAKK